MTECKVFSLCFLLFKKLLKIHKKSTSRVIWKNKKAFNSMNRINLNKAYLNIQCVQFSSNSRKILEFWLLDDFPRILVYLRGSSRKFESGSNSADLWVSSRKFGSGVVPSIACVTFMVYTNSAIEIIHNTIENPHFCRALRAHINAGFLRFPYFVAFSGDLAKLLRSLRSQYIL